MPADAEGLLDALEGSDGDTPDEGAKKDGNPVRDLRKFAEQVLKEKKQADAENQRLAAELAQYRAEKEAALLSEMGLDEKKASLFKAVNPDKPVTKEAVEQFIQEYGLATPDGTEGEVIDDTPAPASAFQPTVGGGAAQPGKTYSSDELIQLIMSGKADEAHEIVSRATRNPSLITFKHADKMPA